MSLTCQQISSILNTAPGLAVLNATHLSNGVVVDLPGLVPSCMVNGLSSTTTTNDLCRIIVNVTTSASSTNRIEAWLPDNWNGRFLATGNGGIGGCIDYANLQHGAGLGFATFGTNGGHDGQTGFEFFLNRPEDINDFGYRAIHAEAEAGKYIIEQYYGRKADYNYYSGCSTGGRQGFEEAILYPDDFHGILMGSMGVDWLHIVASKGILARRMGWPDLSSPKYITAAQWSAIVKAQIDLLDPLDGVTDGIIDDPTSHTIDPSIFGCGNDVLNSSLCLTDVQVQTVREIYEPLTNSEGDVVYPSFDLGADTSVFSANTKTVDGTTVPELTYTVLQDYWRGAVYNSSTWTPHNFTIADMDFAVNLNPGGINIAGGLSHNVSAYHFQGGKLLAYHGRADQTVTSAVSSRAFHRTAETLDLSLEQMHDFYRLFYVPGMGHCAGGVGAWSIGQPNVNRPPGEQFNNTDNNILLALVDWVEEGNAPQALVGTKFKGDRLGEEVEAQRTHCVYPSVSRWDGVGDAKKAESWRCELA
ncbi:unnamed protein product [Periconia digitata]|uniref:Carboxylic ester hydrolase n=1 Tax=Periconia digitata TaxID=1303443 RepID=A0A9W4XQH8_9PLEO|nr:unnamed protein product [Periconia digitata]